MKISDFIRVCESWCPASLALSDDPVGLQIGSVNSEMRRVLVTLDVREQTVNEAIARGCQLILAKHPVIFSPISSLTDSDSQEAILRQLVMHNIAVYTCHTGIDVLSGGLNDRFCEQLDITDVENLCDDGLGRIGNVAPQTLVQLTEKVKRAFGLTRLRVVTYDHALTQNVQRVAICGGSGGKFWPIAKEKDADVYITGDIYYHTAHELLSSGMCAIDPGHYIERAFIPLVAEKLRELAPALEIHESEAATAPFYDI
ncbi:MAG: Nif3-like dinuclear metal center hexameric protein [Streptococcaceae bacterium]|jgi:dinuclear metal center YbgI/SA1388 family protein|nr:Nif3-like dinuclear metal center hexameric protein [Streptococcaceae bacterium]